MIVTYLTSTFLLPLEDVEKNIKLVTVVFRFQNIRKIIQESKE